MACNQNNNHRCRCRRGCMKMARGCWQNFPFYGGPCPDLDGCYGWRPFDDEQNCCEGNNEVRQCCEGRRRRCGGPCCGMFNAFLPMAVSANGIIPLVMNNPCRNTDFDVSSGMVTLEKGGTYLADYSVRVPETAALDTTVTLNVNDASQSSAIARVLTEAGTSTSDYNAQAIFQADEGDTVALRSSEAINVTETSVQPLFTLSLVRLGE